MTATVEQTRRLDRFKSEVATRSRRARYALTYPTGVAVVALVLSELIANEIQLVATSHTKTAIGAGICLVLLVAIAWKWAGKNHDVAEHAAYGQTGENKLTGRTALILCAGLDSHTLNSQAASILRRMPNLQYLAVIGDPNTAKLGTVSALVDKLAPAAGIKLAPSKVRSWEFGSVESVADSEEATSEAIRWLLGRHVEPHQIVVDVTSARRPVCYGAKDAADEWEIETQYVTEKWDIATNQPVPGTHAVKIIKTYHA